MRVEKDTGVRYDDYGDKRAHWYWQMKRLRTAQEVMPHNSDFWAP